MPPLLLFLQDAQNYHSPLNSKQLYKETSNINARTSTTTKYARLWYNLIFVIILLLLLLHSLENTALRARYLT